MGKIVLVDGSGSMGEEGKKSVVRYLLYSIEGLLQDEWAEMPFEIFMAAEEVEKFDGKLNVCGHINEKKLENFLQSETESTLLFMTDGSLSEGVRQVLRKATNRILILMVGCDCNRIRLRKLTNEDDLYESKDVASCVSKFASIT